MKEEQDMRCMELEDSCDVVFQSSCVHSEQETWILILPSISLPEIHSVIIVDSVPADSINCEFNQLQTLYFGVRSGL